MRRGEGKSERRGKRREGKGDRSLSLERLVQADRNRRSLGASSPWLRSVAGCYGQLFFTLRANDRYVFSLQGWTYPFVGSLLCSLLPLVFAGHRFADEPPSRNKALFPLSLSLVSSPFRFHFDDFFFFFFFLLVIKDIFNSVIA